ncbi:sugar diacid recognition domain-containing protein [Bacillaceae bacterium S4-13-56]
MDVLTKEIAQEIAQRTMKIIPYNINVMDEYGVIMASGVKERIGTVHEGARLVIEEGSRVDIKKEDSESMLGVKPGINLPILFEQKIVGVIGISGDPKELSPFGELVKMGAEMTIQQAFLTEQLQWDERLKEELMSQIVNGNLDELARERAKRLKIDLESPRIVIIIAFSSSELDEERVTKRRREVFRVIGEFFTGKAIFANTNPNEVTILRKAPIQRSVLMQEMISLQNTISRIKSISFKVSIGSEYQDIVDAPKAYRQAKEAGRVGEIFSPHQNIYFFDEWILPVTLSSIPNHDHGLIQRYERLVDKDKKGELRETLKLYIDENGDVSKIADQLFIHRNTLRYRLEKIHEITGRDPRKLKDLLELYISQLLNQLKR